MELSTADRQRIATAIAAAERQTSGEIVCVLARSSADAAPLAVTVAALVALASPWLLVALTRLPVLQILWLQLAVFLVLVTVLCLPAVRIRLLPAATRRAMAHRVANEQFLLRGIGRTRGRTGVLIFVALAERYARVVADEGIAARVGQAEWQGAVDSLVEHMRDGRIADGFVAAIERCGGLLGAHFPPPPGGHAELPDRIYVI